MMFNAVVCADAVVATRSSSAAYALLIGSMMRYVVVTCDSEQVGTFVCGVVPLVSECVLFGSDGHHRAIVSLEASVNYSHNIDTE